MSRLPRRPLRVQPPLRGRAVTRHYRGQYAPLALVHPVVRPPSSPLPMARVCVQPPGGENNNSCPSPPTQENPVPQPAQKSLFKDLFSFFRGWVRLVRKLDQPWQWLLALVIVLVSVLLLPRFL